MIGPNSHQGGGPQATLQDIVSVHGLHQQLLDQISNTVTSQNKQVSNTLTDLIQEQCKEIIKHMDTQLEYLRTQNNAILGWRLKQHHTAILKELKPFLTSMMEAIRVETITLDHASVQAQYENQH